MPRIFFKSILFAVSIFYSLSMAQPMTLGLYFTSLKVNQKKMADYCGNISELYTSTYGDKFNDDCVSDSMTNNNLMGGIRVISLLDSSVEIYFYGDASSQGVEIVRRTQNCVGPYPEDSTVGVWGSHQFSEVFETELLRFQENGVIELPKDSLKIVIKKTVDTILKNNHRCIDMDQSEYSELENSGGSLLGPGCCSLVKSPDALPSVAWTPSSIRFTKMGESRFFIHGIPNGSDYTLFDLNGKVLKQGAMLSKTIQPPMLPAILKIQNQIMMLK